jgi:hypothetical protein
VRVHVTSQQPIGVLGKELFTTHRTTITGTVVGVAIAVPIGSDNKAILRRRGSKGTAGTPGGLLRWREIGSVGRGKVGLEGRHPGKAHGAQRAGVLAAAAAQRLNGGRQVVQVSAVHMNFQLHSVPAGEGAERTGQLKVRGSAAPQAKLGVKFQIIFHLETRKKSVFFKQQAVLRIHDILMWIRIRIWILGSMPLPHADPDPSIFIIDLQDANKKIIFYKKFLNITFYRYFYIIFQR